MKVPKRFKEQTHQKLFEHMIQNPPYTKNGVENWGASIYGAFWRGYHGTGMAALVKNTPVHAAHEAGKFYKKNEAKLKTEAMARKIISAGKRVSVPELRKKLEKALKTQKRYAEQANSTNPSAREPALEAKGKAEAIEAVLDALNGNQMYLNILAG